jgi:hypothetical protein
MSVEQDNVDLERLWRLQPIATARMRPDGDTEIFLAVRVEDMAITRTIRIDERAVLANPSVIWRQIWERCCEMARDADLCLGIGAYRKAQVN